MPLSTDIYVVELAPEADGPLGERPAPVQAPSNKMTILRIYGSMSFASAYPQEEHRQESESEGKDSDKAA